MLAKSASGTIDPMVNYTLAYWQLYQATYDGLLAFKKAGANEAFTVVPDLAQAVPKPTNGARRWVFKLRKGIKFSNGKTVTPNDVAASFRRIFKVKSPTSGTFYSGIVGAKACLAHPAGCTLKGGVIANNKAGTVTINLVAPDSEFKYRLAVPHASILPADAPPKDVGTKPIPGTKYASQVHISPLTAFWYVPMNTNLPPFNNVKARRALSYAVDRNATIKIFGGPNLASPSCQVLPPGFPGHKDYCPYTKNPGTHWSAPDMAKAKALVKASGTAGQKVTVVSSDDVVNKGVAVYLQSVLNQFGYKAKVKPISANISFTYPQNTKNKVQINVQQWYQDYPAASDFLYILFGCESFHPGSDSSINMAGFCDKKINAKMHQALKLSVTNEQRANTMWSQIDRMVTDQAPMVTLFNPKHVDFVSKRVGNFTFSKEFYWLVDQSWVQ